MARRRVKKFFDFGDNVAVHYNPPPRTGKSRRLVAKPAVFKVKFGNVTISGAKPSAAVVKANVARSTKALQRAAEGVMKPGVVIRRKKGVPRYAMAEDQPGVFIRRLDGRKERGRFVNGTFEVIE